MALSFDNMRIFLTLFLLIVFSIGLVFYTLNNYSLLKRKSIRSLLFGFKAKMWMTFGLGIFFFSFYFFSVWALSHLIDHQIGLSLFFKVYEAPVSFVYGGLITFVCFSFLIYLARMIIKYLFITKGKGG